VKAKDFKTSDADPFRGDTLEVRQGSVVRVMSQQSKAEREIVIMNEKVG